MAENKQIPLSSIIIPENRARSYDPLKAEALAKVIAVQGQLQPIKVRPKGDAYELVIGRHRLGAFHILGKDCIEAKISELSDDEARLEEVMENLARAELIALDRCQHLYELKQTYERMYPEAKNGGDRGNQHTGGRVQTLHSGKNTEEIFGFAQHVAEQIGLSKRTIHLAVSIWKGLTEETRPRLYGTDLAKKQTELKALSELPDSLQTKVLDLIFDEASDVTNVSGALAALKGGVVLTPVERRVAKLREGIAQVEDATLDLIIGEHADRIIASLKRTGRL